MASAQARSTTPGAGASSSTAPAPAPTATSSSNTTPSTSAAGRGEKPGEKKKGRGKKKGKSAAETAKEVVVGAQPARPKPRPRVRKTAAAGADPSEETGAGPSEDTGGANNDGPTLGGGQGGASSALSDSSSNRDGSPSADGDRPTGGDANTNRNEDPPEPVRWASRATARWPQEMRKVYDAMEREGAGDWGSLWEDLALAYIAFEEACGFPYDRVGMVRTGRVTMVERWMKINRPYSFGPTMIEGESVEGLAMEWWSWWKGLQPPVRVRGDGGLDRPVALDWGGLKDHAGKNGVGLVVMVLLWWGSFVRRADRVAEDSQPAMIADWEVAVEETTWALESMVKMGGLTK